MKNIVFAKIHDYDGDVFYALDFDVPMSLLKFNRVADLKDDDIVFEFLDDIVHECIYGYLDGEDLEFIKDIYVTFVHDNGNFICSFVMSDIQENYDDEEDDWYLSYDIVIVDWENSGYIFGYAEDEGRYYD